VIDLDNTPLWQAFRHKAGDKLRQIVMVGELAERTANRLDLVRDTFPTYTLHNRTHARNVICRMGDLLGPAIERLSSLEAAVLILSAYCHDVGMVFEPDEREALSSDDFFEPFLEAYPDARLKYEHAGVTDELAEWFCRWRHPDRVFDFLRKIPVEEVSWDITALTKPLGDVCRSHGYDVTTLLDDAAFPTSYLGVADLRFCAIILRLADILDFDNTRAPDEVYRYLDLPKRTTPRKAQSDVEWCKHLASRGFLFPDDRSVHYDIRIVAQPDSPEVEYDVRQFLDAIEEEMRKCDRVLRHCDARWADFKLPWRIDRSNINSNGYRYREHRFSLSKERILELLMGENLYDDSHVCIRELLQNAIDTMRHRVQHEISCGVSDFRPQPIRVSTWIDGRGYRWMRFDDDGMGMSEEIIDKYFLKVGQSYYQSAEFRAEAIEFHTDFKPISRFGIGILSCFILGDRVEVSTRHVRNGRDDPPAIRLSLRGLHSFHVVQCEEDRHYNPADMPAPGGTVEAGYRKARHYGTSIAVRINPRNEQPGFDMKQSLDKYVQLSPVPIEYEGELVGGDRSLLVETPWIDQVVEERLRDDELEDLQRVLGIEFAQAPRFRLLPLDLSKHSPTPHLRGQAVLGYLAVSEVDAQRIEDIGKHDERTAANLGVQFDGNRDDGRAAIEASRHVQAAHGTDDSAYVRLDMQRALDRLSPAVRRNPAQTLDELDRWLSHNGIVVPVDRPAAHFDSPQVRLRGNTTYVSSFWLRQRIALGDGLRPDLSLSRDRLQALPWTVYSAIALAFRRALHEHRRLDPPAVDDGLFASLMGREPFALERLVEDPLLAIDGAWAREEIIPAGGKRISLEHLRRLLDDGRSVPLGTLPGVPLCTGCDAGAVEVCALTLLQLGVDVGLSFEPAGDVFVARAARQRHVAAGKLLFPPLSFVPYEGREVLRSGDHPLNESHPFSRWLIENACTICERFPSIFQALRVVALSPLPLDRDDARAQVASTNDALERLWALNEKLRPARRMTLSIDDWEVPYGSL
jgi:hypothetical protein